MIKNVILDVGNVLVDYCWEKHLASFGFPADIAERVAKATALSEDWEEYDRGDDPALWGAASCHDGGYLYSFFGSTPPALPQNKEVYRLQMLD